jgi:hypothetical protein
MASCWRRFGGESARHRLRNRERHVNRDFDFQISLLVKLSSKF